MSARRTPIYRSLHGAPMLAGVPVHYLLGLLGLGVVVGVGGMFASRLVGLVGLLVVGSLWSGLGLVFGRDRVVVPILLLRLRFRFPAAISSYAPSYLRLTVLGEDEGRGR
jgi:hypothetical protein